MKLVELVRLRLEVGACNFRSEPQRQIWGFEMQWSVRDNTVNYVDKPVSLEHVRDVWHEVYNVA